MATAAGGAGFGYDSGGVPLEELLSSAAPEAAGRRRMPWLVSLIEGRRVRLFEGMIGGDALWLRTYRAFIGQN